MRLDIPNTDNRIYYFGLRKYSVTNSDLALMRNSNFADFASSNDWIVNEVELFNSNCDKTSTIGFSSLRGSPPNRLIRELFRIDSLNNFVAAQAKMWGTTNFNQYVLLYSISSGFSINDPPYEFEITPNSNNNWIITYDALRQGLFVASGDKVISYFIDFSTCFGK